MKDQYKRDCKELELHSTKNDIKDARNRRSNMNLLVVTLISATVAQSLAEKPIEKIFMNNVEYDIQSEKRQTTPVKLASTIIENRSRHEQHLRRDLRYEVDASSAYTFSSATQSGVPVELRAGTPIIGSTTKISQPTTSRFIYGSETKTTESGSISARVKVPANSKMSIHVTGTRYTVEIPYTASIKKIYKDGTHKFAQVNGVYRGVAVVGVQLHYSQIEPLQ